MRTWEWLYKFKGTLTVWIQIQFAVVNLNTFMLAVLVTFAFMTATDPTCTSFTSRVLSWQILFWTMFRQFFVDIIVLQNFIGFFDIKEFIENRKYNFGCIWNLNGNLILFLKTTQAKIKKIQVTVFAHRLKANL